MVLGVPYQPELMNIGARPKKIVVDSEVLDQQLESGGIVPIGSQLPYNVQISTSELLDVLTFLSSGSQRLGAHERKAFRENLNHKLYPRTCPGFMMQIIEGSLNLGYAGQPSGHGKLHYWRLFYDRQTKDQVEGLLKGTALAPPNSAQANNAGQGNAPIEWGGLYLRSEAEKRIAESLDKQGILFFANARGRVSLNGAMISNGELNGRVEVDFLVLHQGKSLILEVDGKHHNEQSQTVRDYARDRVLLKSGVPTIRFVGRDCLDRPDAVVSECLSILCAA
jgi:very-short-patch-repair endonuclease